MKKIWILIIVVVIIVVAVAIFYKPAPKGTIKIGVIAPLTGEASEWGIPPKEGVELGLEMIKNKINGSSVEVIYEDTQCDPAKGVSAVQKLINIDKVDAIIGEVCSSVTLAVAPIMEEKKIPLISPASTNPKISTAGDYIFRVVPSDALRGEIFAEYIKNNVGIDKVAILYINNEGGAGNKDSFKEKFEELGGKIVTIESYQQSATDVKTQLTKIEKQNPRAVIVVSYPADSVIVLKQAKELELNLPLYFQTEALEDPSVIKGVGDAANGVVYILPAEPLGKEVDKFKNAFKEKFNKEPALYAAEGFDVFNLVIKTIKECNAANSLSQCIKDKLYTIKNYQGASGIITFDKNGDVLKPMAIKIIENGEKKVLMTK
jgi:branched-chain amino acid transport system substrate-binding protein